MRMHVACHVSKGSLNLRMQWVAHIKDESPPRVMIIRKEHSAGGHREFGVMYVHRRLIGCDGRHQMSIRRRRRVCIDHCEKVIALASHVSGPGKQVVPWRSEERRVGKECR